MSNLNATKNANDDKENFESLTKYIRYQRLSQSDGNKLANKINDIGYLGVDENDKNSDQDNIIPKNDYLESYSDTIKNKIDEVEKLGLNELKTDKSLQEIRQNEFLDAQEGKSFLAQIFCSIKNIQYQFALVEYALQNGQNPMDLFNIDIDWMMNKAKKSKTVKLNGRKIQLQNKNDEKRLFCPEFYLKCELVFNLFCLYDGKNLFDLFSAKEMIRLFGSYSEYVFRFCCEKKADINKNTDGKSLSSSILTQLEKEFESMDKEDQRTGGFLGFLFSLILIVIVENIFAVSSPLIFLIVPLGILAGWASGKIQALREYNKILNLRSQTNKENNVSLMRQTFEAFKSKYEFFKQNPPVGMKKFNNGNMEQSPQVAADNTTEKLDDSICSSMSSNTYLDEL